MKIAYFPNQYSQQRQRQKPVWVYPVRMAMEAEYYMSRGYTVYWNQKVDADKVITKEEMLPFEVLPAPDRIFTDAKNKRYQSYGNYKYHPATHMQVADGCWWGKCSFCIEKKKTYIVRNMLSVLEEIVECERQGFREIFDDSGTFPVGDWLKEFCSMFEGTKLRFGCNMRVGAQVDYRAMKKAGFRMLLYGVESFNQFTLDKIKKGIKAQDIDPTMRRAAMAGLEPHAAIMLGYPWESAQDEKHTIKSLHNLLRKGFVKTAQASLYSVSGVESIDRGNINSIYSVAKYPDFWIRKLRDIRDMYDLIYLMKSVRKGIVRD